MNKLYTYKLTKKQMVLPFKVGDFVKIKGWGGIYVYYTAALIKFGVVNEHGAIITPFYSDSNNEKNDVLGKRIFKIIGMLEHEYGHDVICYVKDREGKDAVISGEYLIPFKNFPLRPGEKYYTKLEKIKTR